MNTPLHLSLLFTGCNKHEHMFGNWQTQEEATCTTQEIQSRVCECGEKETRLIGDMLSHMMTEWNEVSPATCTEARTILRTCL